MKKITLFFLTIVTAFSLTAQPPKVPAKKGTNFGNKTAAAGAVSANELPALLEGKQSADIKVKGKVVEVCKAEGCWIRMQTASGSMMIKMKDHAFLVPLALNGKTIVAEGTASVKETSIEMQKHLLEDAGKTKAEIDAVTAPKKEIILQATGILVVK
jgi:hypothetical protein